MWDFQVYVTPQTSESTTRVPNGGYTTVSYHKILVEHLIFRVSLKIMINVRPYEETLLVLEIYLNKMPRETHLFSF